MKQKKKLSFLFPLKTILLSVLFLAIAILFVIISVLFFTQNDTMAKRVATQFQILITSQVLDNFDQYFQNAENNLSSVYRLAQAGLINLDSKDEIIDILKSLVASDEKLNALYLGAEKTGNFYMAKRMPDNTISTRFVYRTSNSIVSEWKHSSTENEFNYPAHTEYSLEDGYDPRRRPWYKNANSEEIKWSEPYIFSSDRIVGITATRKLALENGFNGVISVDIGLNYLHDFIAELFYSTANAILVVDDQNRVISYQGTGLENLKAINYSELKNVVNVDEISLLPEFSYLLDNYKSIVDNISSYRKTFIELLSAALIRSDQLNSLQNIVTSENTSVKNIKIDKKEYIYSYAKFNRFNGLNWNFHFIIKDDSLVGDFKNTIKLGLIILTIAFIIVVLLYSNYITKITNKIKSLSTLMGNISNLKLDERFENREMLKITEINNMGDVYNRMINSLSSFKKFLPQNIIQYFIKKNREIEIRMEQKDNLTLFFSDIVSFTTISEKSSPSDLAGALNIYFNELSKVITQNGGIIDKYIGDAIMAVFGVFESESTQNRNSAELACYSALNIQLLHKSVNEKIKKRNINIEFKTRIGINTGTCLIGMIGSDERLNYTTIGDNVNLASRLEALNKNYNTSIIISESTKNMLSSEFQYKLLDTLTVKGKEIPTSIYHLYGFKAKPQEIPEREEEGAPPKPAPDDEYDDVPEDVFSDKSDLPDDIYSVIEDLNDK